MGIGLRYCCVAAMLLASGCTGGQSTAQSPKQGFENLSKSLAAFEKAIDAAASASPADMEESAENLRRHVGKLEEQISELQHGTGSKAEVQGLLNTISQTANDVRRAAEGTPNFSKLREEIGKLKAQVNELQGKL